MKHLVITPFFNEEKYLETYIRSVIDQINLPDKLILVDDNSTDQSTQIAKKYSEKYDWIDLVQKKSTPVKIQGSKVIQAFNYGLRNIDIENFDFISKIDSDLKLPKNYFSKTLSAFDEDDSIGIAGGRIMEYRNDKWEVIRQSDYHIRGALKSYKKDCFKEIDRLMPVLGWDGLDEMKAFKNGWHTKIVDVNVKHYRPANNDYNSLKINYKYGRANYKNGGNLILATVRFLVRTVNKPFILGGVSYYLGYLIAYFLREKKNVDSDLSKFINKFHLQRLKRFKRY